MTVVEVTDEAWGTKVLLNRPPVNALDTTILSELADALTEIVAKGPALAVLAAAGRVFSAGADLKERHSGAPAMWHRMQCGQRVLDVLRSAPFPTIAAIQGPCLGGAMNVVDCCDVRIARADATFALPEVKVGRAGGSASMRELVTEGTVRWLALTGEPIDAQTALRCGLVQKVLPIEGWEDSLESQLLQIAAHGAESLRTVKEVWSRTQGLTARDGQWMEQQLTYRRWVERTAGISRESVPDTAATRRPCDADHGL